MNHRRAVTLLEMLVVSAFVGILVVAGTRALAHSLRLSERAQMRSELVALAQSQLEEARIMAAMGGAEEMAVNQPDRPDVSLTLGTETDESTGLLQISVTAEATRSVYPLSVTLHGWVMPPEAPS